LGGRYYSKRTIWAGKEHFVRWKPLQGERLIPSQIKSLTSTGKLSEMAMPKAQYYEIYRDFVCGVALRAGRELFAFLPVKTVLVNSQANLLNTRTAQQGLETILYP